MNVKKNTLYALALCATFSFTSFSSADDYDIESFYDVKEVDKVKVLTVDGELEEAKYILTPRRVEAGKYKISVTRKAKDLYLIDGKEIFIQTKYCYEYATREEVFLVVESAYGYTKGKIIFP